MSEKEKPTTEYVSLPSGGSVPGIPGSHGPGRYIIDWVERTLTPVVDVVESAVERVEEAIHTEPAPEPEVPLAPMPTEPVDVPEAAPDETPVATSETAS